jgi:hypothetical protein
VTATEQAEKLLPCADFSACAWTNCAGDHKEHDRDCPAYYRVVVAARIEDLERVLEWQPIETAPKDATCDILLWIPGRAPVVAAWFDGGWAPMDLGGNHIRGNPTHWMPLPAPPIARAALEKGS